MLNEKDFFWKNWRLGTELQVSGSFIYNGLQTLDKMESLYYEEECFELLYNLSVGLERLMKIAVIMLEHDTISSQEEFEKTLITHNHFDLLNRIKAKKKFVMGKTHNKFLVLLDNFYKSVRYERYNIQSVYRPSQDKTQLVKFIIEELKIEFCADFGKADLITKQIRKFIGNVVGKFTKQLYEIVRDEAYRIGTFTYEVTYKSKAFKIYIAEEFDFEKEKIAQKEVMLYLLKTERSEEFQNYLNGIEHLNFEQNHTNKYIESVFRNNIDRQIINELEYIYEEDKPNYKRNEYLEILGTDIDIEYIPTDDDLGI
jgi:hypothetical protein